MNISLLLKCLKKMGSQDFQWKEGDIDAPTNLQRKICPAYEVCRNKDGAETEGTANVRPTPGASTISDTINDALLCFQSGV